MLRIRIFSFSYLRSGIPKDETSNGGGFIFDCRFVENPGNFPEFKPFTALDKPVRDYLEKDNEMKLFLKNAAELTDAAIEKYLSRGYTDLMIGFGCTGGQHRSPYAAEKLKEHIEEKFMNVSVEIKHNDII